MNLAILNPGGVRRNTIAPLAVVVVIAGHAMLARASFAQTRHSSQSLSAQPASSIQGQFVLDMRDSIRLVGQPRGISAIVAETDFGKVRIPLGMIDRIEFGQRGSAATIKFKSDDRLTAIIRHQAFPFRTPYGEVVVPRADLLVMRSSTSPPPAVARRQPKIPARASVGGKYHNLLRVVPAPGDVGNYGTFNDYGHYTGTSYLGHNNLPPGFWVYVAPNWYIWKDMK